MWRETFTGGGPDKVRGRNDGSDEGGWRGWVAHPRREKCKEQGSARNSFLRGRILFTQTKKLQYGTRKRIR